MRIAITGATGMIGSKLIAFLLAQGHQIAVLTRRTGYRPPQTTVIMWDPELNYIETGQLEGFDVIIHLAGANVGEYWSPEYKRTILESRLQSTNLLCKTLARLVSKPKLLISASAVGYYGNRPSHQVVDEEKLWGDGFLADVCYQWEKETRIAADEDIRVVCMRLGIVLSPSGGALAKMRKPFQLGMGGCLGNGRQMMSWIALDEIPFVVDHVIKTEGIKGPVNVVAPQAVSNAQFTKILGQVLHRPTLLPVPGFVVRLLFGEMGQSLLLDGVHVLPRCLQESGYQFRFSDLKEVLKTCLI